MMTALSNKPYAMFTFLFMFKHVHETHTMIDENNIEPDQLADDFNEIIEDVHLLNNLAVIFDEI